MNTQILENTKDPWAYLLNAGTSPRSIFFIVAPILTVAIAMIVITAIRQRRKKTESNWLNESDHQEK